MRLAFAAGALCLSLVGLAGPVSSPAPASAPVDPVTLAASGDAAAKHAKRTACLKDAKVRKLVGADKTAFLKSCIAAP
jgi:hypothetical protein